MRKILFALAAATGILIPTSVQATDDNPCGNLYDHKVDNLSGKTFTIPQPPAGWTVKFAVVKVGGPGGGSHITFDPASAGQVLDVSNQQYDISHVHVCKSQGATTSTSTSTTSTSTSTIPVESSTTTSTSTVAPTTTAPESTSTSSPSSTSPDTTEPSSTSLPEETASTSLPVMTTSAPAPTTSSLPPSPLIPETGSSSGLIAVFAAALVIAGWLLVRSVRRAA